MSPPTTIDLEDLFDRLAKEIAEWEDSPYYLEDEELFDLERFLLDHQAEKLKKELERGYGKPLNNKFWSSSLAYQRLKLARKAVKGLDIDQEKRREEYAQAVERGKKDWQQWLKDLSVSQRRAQFRIIPGGENDSE